MDKVDSDFLHQLFQENNQLRAQFNALQRELYNKTVQNETLDEEIRDLRLRMEEEKAPAASRPTTQSAVKKGPRIGSESVMWNKSVLNPNTCRFISQTCPSLFSTLTSWRPPQDSAVGGPNAAKDLAEALFTLERKSAELKQVREDLGKTQSAYEEEVEKAEDAKRQANDVMDELHDLRRFRANALKAEEDAQNDPDKSGTVSDDYQALQSKFDEAQTIIQQQKRQIVDIAADANRRHNEQQNQLQGVEALIEGIRKEYEEFIEITKLENDAYRTVQQDEYNKLRDEFETHKREQFEEKKQLMQEYQGLLYAMQSQFDEYRTTSEFLFNVEAAKLEDELSSQAARYEQEIMYVVQAKDKFYADMMIAKDAKIMSLIEGSDLQNLMQKHEMDMEALRKTHAREIDHLKTSQESEQKSLVSLLQRQNLSLESKCDKLQSHLKTLETRIKELVATVEARNKTISDKEDAKGRLETDYARKVDEYNAKMGVLIQEKEHLRHKVIRMALDAKGEGHNSIANMLKRISRETSELRFDYEGMSIKYSSLMSENQLLGKRLKEREKFAEFLEKEVARRTEEYNSMTRTFEDFLSARARQNRKDRARRLMKLHGIASEEGTTETIPKEYVDSRGVLRTQVPGKEIKAKGTITSSVSQNPLPAEKDERRAELERGFAYLRRFKTISRAFASGDFRLVPAADSDTAEGTVGNWQKTALYSKLESANLALARFYKEPPRDDLATQIQHPKPLKYAAAVEDESSRPRLPQPTDTTLAPGLKLYDEKAHDEAALSGAKTTKTEVVRKEDKPMLIVGKIR